jgi:hypothetical protein
MRLCVTLALLLLASPAHGGTLTLTWPTGPAPCNDIADLQACVNAAGSGDVIEIAANAIPGGQSINIPESGQPRKSLTLRPAAGFTPVFGDFTTIFAAGGDEDVTILIEGLTIERGRIGASQGGEGTFNVTYRDNRILGTASFGDALQIRSGNTQPPYGPTLFLIENNEIHINVDPTDQVSGISVGGFQGGVNVGSIVGNVIRQFGGDQNGAIDIANGNAVLEVDVIGNQISGSNFNEGVGIFQFAESGETTARIINNAISGQTDDAGAPAAISLNVSQGTARFTVLNNTAAFNDGGLLFGGRPDLGASASALIANNIFAFNDSGVSISDFDTTTINEFNLVFGNGRNFYTPGPGTVIEDPLFVSPDNLRTRLGSPARDAGDNALVPPDIAVDVVGNPRIQDGTVDIGAFEDRDDVLVLNEQCGGSLAHLPVALANLGLDFFETQDTGAFESALTSGTSWDLILVDEYSSTISEAALTALREYIATGGRIYMNHWAWDDSLATVESFGAALGAPRMMPPVVDPWQPEHPLFTEPNPLGSLTPGADTCDVDAWGFDPLEGARAVAGYTPSDAPGEAGIVVGNAGRTILFGSTPGLYPAEQMVPFLENVIGFLLAPDILLLDAECGGSLSHFPTALEGLELAFVRTTTGERFDAWLSSGRDWRLVIVDSYSQSPGNRSALEAYVVEGGRAWWNGFNTDPATAAAFETSLGAPYSEPRAIGRWPGACCDPGHPLYRDPAVPRLLEPNADTCGSDGFELSPVGTGVALAGFTPGPTLSQGALVSGNGGRTLHFGGIPGLFPAEQMLPLLDGALRFLLTGYPLYSAERFGPLLRTVEPGSGTSLDTTRVSVDGVAIAGSRGLAMNPLNGEIWQLTEVLLNGDIQPGGPSLPAELSRLDPLTGMATPVGTPEPRLAALAFDCRGTLFGVSGDGDPLLPESLFELSSENGSATFLTALGNGDDGEALGYSPAGDLLYHASGDTDQIFESIDPFSLGITPIPLSGSGFGNFRALTYLSPDQMLASAGSDLLTIDTATGLVEILSRLDHTTKGLANTDLRCCSDPEDADCDGNPNATDLCPFYIELDPFADADGDGRGDECECGDQDANGAIDIGDILAINAAIFAPEQVTPLCDANNDGRCNIDDILAVNADIFSPASTTTCARQPIEGP